MGTRKRNPSAGRRRRRPRRELPGWVWPTIGTLAVLGVLIGVGVSIYRTVQARWAEIAEYLDPGNAFDLSYLPPDADCYILLRSSALRRSGSVHAFIDSAHYREGLEPAWELLGLAPENIASATCGAVGFGRQLGPMLNGEARAAEFVTVIRLIEPEERISARDPLIPGEEVEHAGRSYVRIQAPSAGSSPRTLAVFSPNSSTVVFGSEDQVRAALDRLEQGTPPPRRTELDFVNSEHHLLIVLLSKAAAEAGSAAEGESGRPLPASFREFVETIDRMPDRASLGLTFAGDEITIEALCRFDNASRRAAFAARIEEIRATAGEQLAAEQARDRSGVSRRWELASAGKQTLEAMRVDSDADAVTVSTVVPCDYLIERDLLRVHLLATTPFNLSLQDTPRLMLGLEETAPEED